MSSVRPFVVISGLAGSGKSTIAEPLGAALGLPVISKDAIKEALFEAVGIGDWQWSKTLSRAADAALVEIAKGTPAAVLDNYWHRETVAELLAPLGGSFVEVWCRVEPEVARGRFASRSRHAGHADAENPSVVLRSAFPLGMLGPVVEVDTADRVDIQAVADEVIAAALRLQVRRHS